MHIFKNMISFLNAEGFAAINYLKKKGPFKKRGLKFV